MERSAALLFLVATLLSLSSNLRGSSCLFSRLEIYNCTFNFPTRTSQPGPNQVGVYDTNFKNGACAILRSNHRVLSIRRVESTGGTVFFLDSPNKDSNSGGNYSNDRLVFYNVNCGPNQLIYFELTNISLESTMCLDERVNAGKCLDYIQVRTPDNNIISENCGQDASNLDGVVLPFNTVRVLFRTNRKKRFLGFSATATCFNPAQCPSELRWETRRRASAQSIRQTCPETSFKKIEIPYGHDLYYQHDQQGTHLTLVERKTNQTKGKWFNQVSVQSIEVFSMNGSTKEYRRPFYNMYHSIRNEMAWFPYPLKGPGILYLPKRSDSSIKACFQDYLVDVSALVPTVRQKQKILRLNNALHTLANVKNPHQGFHRLNLKATMMDTDPKQKIPYSTLEKLKVIQFLKYLVKALAQRGTGEEQMHSFIASQTSNETCNPILETSARLYDAVEGVNPELIQNYHKAAGRN